MKKTTSTIRNQATPILLSLFSAGLAGCSSNTTVAPTTVSGTAVKGLLKNAEAFVDTDGDGAWTSGVDSDKVRTAEDGSFSIVTDLTGDIVVQTDESTIDASSGAVLAGITMSAMAGSSVVSVATTITNELVDAATTAGNTLSQADAEAQVKAILGISATVDVASYNPYASANAGSTAAVEFEKAAQQVMTVINTLAEAEATTNIGTSVSKSAAISNAITAFVDVVEAKVVEAGTSTVASIDFTAATIIDEVVAAAVTNDSNSVFNDTNFADSLTAIKTAIKSVNTAIDSVNSLDAGSKQTFAVAQTALIDMTQSVASSNDDSKATIDINTTVEQISKMVVVNGTTSGILTEDDAKSSNDDGSLVLKGTASIIDPDTTDNVSYTFSTTVTTITSDSASGTALGSLTITSAGVWTYTVDDSHADIQALGVKDSLTEVFQVKSIATDATNPEALVTSDSATKYIQVKISGNNDAPTLSEALADTATAEDAAFTLDIPKTLITDLDSHDSHKVTASLENGDKLPDWLTLTSHSSGDNIATLAGTPVNSDVGAINITLTYSDGNAKVSDTFTLTVTNTNDAPTVAATIADQTTAEDAAFSFTIPSDTFADVDTNDTSLTITATGLPTGLTLTDGVISGTPTNAVVGDHTVTITATDSSNATVTDEMVITVTNTNDAPTVANAQDNQTATEDTSFSYTIPTNTFADVDTNDTSLTITATGLPNGLTLTDGVISGTPTNAAVGDTTVSITATDSTGASVTDQIVISVTNVNDAPTVANAQDNQTTAEDSAFSYTIPTNTFADVDTNDTSLTITATGLPTGLTLTDGVISGTPTNAVVGDHTVTITATDSSNATVTDEMVITVTNTNDAPTVANAQDNQTATEDTSFSYTIPTNTFADVDTNDTSLTITATGLPNGLTLTDGVISGTPTNAAVGDTTVSITATDSTGASVTDQIVISVTNVNDAPTVANAQDNQTTAEDSAFSYTIPTNTFADVDTNDTSLTITATGLPTGLTLTDGVISGTPTNAVVGDHTVTITATDSSNATVTDEMVISVTNVNDAPTVVTAQTAQQTSENVAFSYTVPTGTFADVDADSSLTYSATLASGDALLPTWLTFNAGTATFSGTPASSDVAVLSITVTANDGVATVSDTLALTVTENAIPTVANAQDNLTATEDSAFSYTVPANTFADADANDTNLTITAADLPDGLTFTTGVISGTPTNAAVGDTTVSIIATDTAGASITDQIVISVANTNDAPTVANELVDQTTISGRESIYTIATNSFADVDASDTLTYSVTLEGGASVPSWLVINSTTGALTANPTASDAGSISVTVTATDSASSPLTAADTFTIAVTANQTPSVTGLANQTATEDTAVSFSLADTSFADADSDSLTVTVSGEPTWLSYDADTKTFSGTPTTDSHAGTSTITVTATDASGAAGAATFDLVTSASNDAPVFSSAASLNVAANSSVATTATISDEESDTMIYTVSGTDATSFSIDASTGALSFVGVRTDMMMLLDSSGNQGALLADNYTSTTTDGVTQVTVDLYATPASIGSEAWAAFQFEQTSSDANADMSIAIDSGIGGMYSENGGKSIWFHMSQPLNAIEAVKLGTLTIANYSASETYSLTNMAIRGGDSGTSNDSLLLANDLTLSSVTDLPNAADSYSVIVTATDSNDSSSSVSQTLAITIDAATANINSSTTTATWTGTTAADTYTIDSLAASADGGNGDNDVAKISIENHTTWDTTGGTSELVATLVDMEIIDIGNLVVSNDSTPVTIADFSTNMVIDATSAASLTAGNDSQVSIMGTTNDIVTLSGSGWAKGANSSLSSGDYASQTLDAWSDGTSTLHIDQEINILTPDIT